MCRVITAVGIFGFSSLATIHFVCCNELCDVAKIYCVRLEICILNSSEGDNCGESLDEQNYITMNRITLPLCAISSYSKSETERDNRDCKILQRL